VPITSTETKQLIDRSLSRFRNTMRVVIGDSTPKQYDKADKLAEGFERVIGQSAIELSLIDDRQVRSEESDTFSPALHEQQHREHQSWLDVVDELKAAGITPEDINEGGEYQSLHDAIVKWGEELVHLRLLDPNPDHAEKALRSRREAYPGRTGGM
jgi:hypothetical protein